MAKFDYEMDLTGGLMAVSILDNQIKKSCMLKHGGNKYSSY